jgi:hypothetical protein
MAVTYSMKRKQWRDVSGCARALGEIAVEHILRSGRYLIVTMHEHVSARHDRLLIGGS